MSLSGRGLAPSSSGRSSSSLVGAAVGARGAGSSEVSSSFHRASEPVPGLCGGARGVGSGSFQSGGASLNAPVRGGVSDESGAGGIPRSIAPVGGSSAGFRVGASISAGAGEEKAVSLGATSIASSVGGRRSGGRCGFGGAGGVFCIDLRSIGAGVGSSVKNSGVKASERGKSRGSGAGGAGGAWVGAAGRGGAGICGWDCGCCAADSGQPRWSRGRWANRRAGIGKRRRRDHGPARRSGSGRRRWGGRKRGPAAQPLRPRGRRRSRAWRGGRCLGAEYGAQHLAQVRGIKGFGEASCEAEGLVLRLVHFFERTREQHEADVGQVGLLGGPAAHVEGRLSRQCDVDQDKIGPKQRKLLERLIAIGDRLDLVAIAGQRQSDHLLDGETVVRHQKLFAVHASESVSSGYRQVKPIAGDALSMPGREPWF
jgi:hypothetical protein